MTVQTVTYHRMAIAVSTAQTTLWDQFGYAGRPEEFSWILPVLGGPDVRVQLADVRFLAGLDEESAAIAGSPPQRPARSCPRCYYPPPNVYYRDCPDPFRGATRDASFSADIASADAPSYDAADTGVTVLREEVVGPYAVATLRGTDAGALRAWLRANNYAVPATLEPVLDHYISLNMDFVALRLRDGAGLGRMQPVRVTAPGYQPLLPLRMVAAGVADHVELVLMTIADSRLEPANFPSTEIGRDFAWDFRIDTTAMGAFRRTERALAAPSGGRAWLTESAATSDRWSLQNVATRASARWRAESPGLSPEQDMSIALMGIGARPVLTRLHADLPVGALDRDLQLNASTLPDHARTHAFGRAMNTATPSPCLELRCDTGLIEGGEGQIRDPFSAVVAPDTVFPASYVRDSLPAYTPRYNEWTPRHVDGSPYVRPTVTVIDRCTRTTTPDGGTTFMLPDGRVVRVPGDGSSSAPGDGGRRSLWAAGGCTVAARSPAHRSAVWLGVAGLVAVACARRNRRR